MTMTMTMTLLDAIKTCKRVPEAAMFFYVNSDVIFMRLHDWSTGGLLLVCPLVLSFAKFHTSNMAD